MKGKIEKEYQNEYIHLATGLYSVWDKYKGVYSDVFYNQSGLSITRFLFDSFYATKIRIGDGIGLSGDITIPNCLDSHLETALASIWNQYPIDRPSNFTGS